MVTMSSSSGRSWKMCFSVFDGRGVGLVLGGHLLLLATLCAVILPGRAGPAVALRGGRRLELAPDEAVDKDFVRARERPRGRHRLKVDGLEVVRPALPVRDAVPRREQQRVEAEALRDPEPG